MSVVVHARLVRAILEGVAEAGSTTMASARARLPDRLALLLGDIETGRITATEGVPISDVEALVFELDALSGASPGSGLERAGKLFAIRTQEASTPGLDAAQRFDACCRALADSFVGQTLSVRVDPGGPGAFQATLELGGRPRMARLLRHFAQGMADMVARASALGARVEASSSVSGDRAAVVVSRSSDESAAQAPPPRRKRSSAMLRAVGPTSQRVDAILGSSSRPPPRKRLRDD